MAMAAMALAEAEADRTPEPRAAAPAAPAERAGPTGRTAEALLGLEQLEPGRGGAAAADRTAEAGPEDLLLEAEDARRLRERAADVYAQGAPFAPEDWGREKAAVLGKQAGLEVQLARKQREARHVRQVDMVALQNRLEHEVESKRKFQEQLRASVELLRRRGLGEEVIASAVQETSLALQLKDARAELEAQELKVEHLEKSLRVANNDRDYALETATAAKAALKEDDATILTQEKKLKDKTARVDELVRQRNALEVKLNIKAREAEGLEGKLNGALADRMAAQREAQAQARKAEGLEAELKEARRSLATIRAEREHNVIEHERMQQVKQAESAATFATMIHQRDSLKKALADVNLLLQDSEGKRSAMTSKAMMHVEHAIETKHRSLDCLMLQSVAHRHILTKTAAEVAEVTGGLGALLERASASFENADGAAALRELREFAAGAFREFHGVVLGLTADIAVALPRAVKQGAALAKALALRQAAEKALAQAAIGLDSNHVAHTVEKIAARAEKRARRFHKTLPPDLYDRVKKGPARPVSLPSALWNKEEVIQRILQEAQEEAEVELADPAIPAGSPPPAATATPTAAATHPPPPAAAPDGDRPAAGNAVQERPDTAFKEEEGGGGAERPAAAAAGPAGGGAPPT